MRPRYLALGICGLLAAGSGAAADEKSDALIQKATGAIAGFKTLRSQVSLSKDGGPQKMTMGATVTLLKPNYGRLRIMGPDGKPWQTMVGDGKAFYVVMQEEKRFMKQPLSPDLGSFQFPGSPLGAALAPGSFFKDAEHRYLGTETVDGKSYEVIEFKRAGGAGTGKAFFGPSGLAERVELVEKEGEASSTSTVVMTNLRLDTPARPAEFAFKPGPGFKPVEEPSYEKALVAVGKKAPDFRLPQLGGVQLALSDALKSKKAVLVNFWFYG